MNHIDMCIYIYMYTIHTYIIIIDIYIYLHYPICPFFGWIHSHAFAHDVAAISSVTQALRSFVACTNGWTVRHHVAWRRGTIWTSENWVFEKNEMEIAEDIIWYHWPSGTGLWSNSVLTMTYKNIVIVPSKVKIQNMFNHQPALWRLLVEKKPGAQPLLRMEEILHHQKDGWNPRNNGINHLSTGAGFRNHPWHCLNGSVC